MWNRETIIGVAITIIGIGGGTLLEIFDHTTIALIVSIILVIGGVIFFIYGFRKSKKSVIAPDISGQPGVSIFAQRVINTGKITSQGQGARTTIVSDDIKNTGTIEYKANEDSKGKPKTKGEDKSDGNKRKAREIHTKLMQLERELWSSRENTPTGKDPRDDVEVKKVYSDIQSETNNLATLVNNNDFEEFIEALLSEYSRILQFNGNPYKRPYLQIINRAHRKIRWYINHKVKD